MKIAVVGTGAMGSIYAGLLAESGNQVWAVDVYQEHIKQINLNGLKIQGPSGDRIVKTIMAVDDLSYANKCDLYIIATKSRHVVEAAMAVGRHMRQDSIILAIQNGLGAEEKIIQFLPKENLIRGVADGFGASLRAPGHVHHSAMNLIRLGELNGFTTPRILALENLWNDAGFNVRVFDNIEKLVWEKFICNVTFSGPCTIFNCSIAELMSNKEYWLIALGCGREAHQVAVVKGISLSFADVDVYVTEFGKKLGTALPSMLQDHNLKRVSEVDALNGMVHALGLENGIDTPYNNILSTIIKARERSFES